VAEAAGAGVERDAEGQAARQPRSAGELFSVFTRLAMRGFGGVLPVAQRELVERQRWLTREEFLEMLSMAQVLPGPNIVNLALILGDRHFGWRGAAAAMGGVLAAPLAVVLVGAALAQQVQGLPSAAGALRGMGAVAAGLVLSTALRLLGGLRRNALGPTACGLLMAATLWSVGILRWPLAAVVLALGPFAVAMAWRRLDP
jgi:chromate transporter